MLLARLCRGKTDGTDCIKQENVEKFIKTIPDTPQVIRSFRRCRTVGENGVNMDLKGTKSHELKTAELDRCRAER